MILGSDRKEWWNSAVLWKQVMSERIRGYNTREEGGGSCIVIIFHVMIVIID